jgi:hypothetical protein
LRTEYSSGGELGTLIVTEENEGTGLDMALVEDLIRRASLEYGFSAP